MRFQLLVISLISAFFVSMALFVLLLKKPICIDSRNVEKIYIDDDKESLFAYRCAVSKAIPYNQELADLLPVLSKRIQTLEQAIDNLYVPQTKIEIHILKTQSKLLRVQNSSIFISRDLITTTSSLEESIVRLWIREQLNEEVIANTNLENSIVDVVLFSMGQYKFQSGLEKWPISLQTVRAFCAQNCDSFRLEDYGKIINASVRPILSQAIISAIQNVGLEQSYLIIQSIPEFLKFVSNKYQLNLMSEFEAVDDIEVLNKDLENVVKIYNDFFDKKYSQFSKNLSLELRNRGIDLQSGAARLDYLITFGEDVVFLKENILKQFHSLDLNGLFVAAADKDSVWLIPSLVSIKKTFLGSIKSHQMLYISCDLPTKEQIIHFSAETEKMLYVHHCAGSLDIKLQKYLKSGFIGFAEENPKISFIQIHLPSLIQGWKGDVVNPLPILAHQDFGKIGALKFFKEIGWKSPEWDQNLKIYKTQSVIQAFEAYRPQLN